MVLWRKIMPNQQRNFMKLWHAREATGLITCLGLDPDRAKMPLRYDDHVNESSLNFAYTNFLEAIITATHDQVGSYKLNWAFYLSRLHILKNTVAYIKEVAPDVPIIVDCKVADIGNTNAQYADFLFDELGADAITVHAWHGHEAMEPFLKRANKGIFVVCRTSNAGGEEFQCLSDGDFPTWWQAVASTVRRKWNYNGNCGLVIGGNCTAQNLRLARSQAAYMPILMPGFGSQGAVAEPALHEGWTERRTGVLPVNASGIIHASRENDYATAARSRLMQFNKEIDRIRGL